MNRALIDSNILIDFLAADERALDELARYSDRSISVINWIEVMAGVTPEDRSITERTLSGFKRIELSQQIADRAVVIRRERRLKLPDAIVQATAQASNLLLVTRNTKDFPESIGGIRNPYVI